MKLIHILRKVYCEPWLIRPEMHAQIAAIVQAHLTGTAHTAGIMDGMEDGAELTATMEGDGVMVIPVDGVIGKRVGTMEKSSGVLDLDDFTAMVEAATASPEVRAVVLDINSPGGTATGLPEAGVAVKALADAKPVIAFTDTQCYSAAYWLASQASGIYATGSAGIGSIGVYMAFLDESRAYEMAGLKQEVFKTGKFKGMGIPGTSLTDEQRALIQAKADGLHAEFKAVVRAGRGDVSDECMQGQDFYGAECVTNGLIDSIASRSEAMRDAAELANNRRSR